jgi:hypothetical protein
MAYYIRLKNQNKKATHLRTLQAWYNRKAIWNPLSENPAKSYAELFPIDTDKATQEKEPTVEDHIKMMRDLGEGGPPISS